MQAIILFGMAACLAASPVFAGADAGESKADLAFKNRGKAPATADIDTSVTLSGLLAKSTSADLAGSKAAHVEGYVIQVEREPDGDVHLALAEKAGETDTGKWVIVEVTPAWQRKDKRLAVDALRKLHGKKVAVTGWLYYEPDADQEDPRGTRWEVHPATSVVVSG